MTQVKVIKPDDLTTDLIGAWSRIQQADSALHNPFCRPEFTQAVGNVRDDVEVAILLQGDRPVGFLPFERSRFNIGRPVGGRVNNFQGMAVEKDVEWDAESVIRGCGLSSWVFSNLNATQRPFVPHHHAVEDGLYMDLSRGFDTYLEEQKVAHRRAIRDILRHERGAHRDFRSVRFEWHRPDDELLDTLLKWKSAQLRATGYGDLFTHDWAVDLLRQVLCKKDEAFKATLSVLFFDDCPAAMTYSLQSFGIVDGWFLAFNREFSRYGPGVILLLELARAMAARDIDRYYLGTGGEKYKHRFATGAVPLARGSVDLAMLPRMYHQSWRRTREFVRNSPLRNSAKAAARVVQPAVDWLAFR